MTASGRDRIIWALVVVACAAVLMTAAWLQPDPAGHGTHTQLGLPPCGFHLLTGVGCPACGLTTAFAHMVRGDVLAAVSANPFGVALFIAMLAVLALSLIGFAKVWPLSDTVIRFQLDRMSLLLVIGAVAAWVGRLLS